jgi:hypothetical protein
VLEAPAASKLSSHYRKDDFCRRSADRKGTYINVGFAASEFSPRAVCGLDKVRKRKEYNRV